MRQTRQVSVSYLVKSSLGCHFADAHENFAATVGDVRIVASVPEFGVGDAVGPAHSSSLRHDENCISFGK